MPNFWVDRLQQHAIHQSLSALKDALADARQRDGDEGIDVALSRLELVANHVRRAVSSVEPFLASTATFDQLDGDVVAMTAEVRGYVSDGAPSHLTTANASADALIPRLHALLVPTVPDDAEALGQSIAALRRTVDQQLQHVKINIERSAATLAELQAKIDTARAEVQAQVDATKNEVTAEKTRLDAALSQFQTQSSQTETARQTAFNESENQRQATATAAEEQRRSQFTATADERTKAFDAIKAEWVDLSAKWRTGHDEEQKSRKDTFDSTVASHKADVERVVGEAREAMAAWAKSAEERATAAIAVLETRKEEARKLVQVIGNTGMTGGYQRVADAAQVTAKNWERIAVGAMVGLIGFALYAFLHAVDSEFKWSVFAARIFVAITCGIPATYAATQSQKHREIERRSRKLELELASIDPYLASLPEEKRIEVKERMAERFFGQTLPESKEAPPTGGVLDVAKATIETAGKAIDAMKQK